MSFWPDRYRPKGLAELTYHKHLTKHMIALSRSEEVPHMLFHGPPGAGKKTRVMCLLAAIFDINVYKLRLMTTEMSTASGKKFEVINVSSIHHIEITPAESGFYDRLVISDILKETASLAQPRVMEGDDGKEKSFKVVVIHETDRLTKAAQQALRRTMELYSRNCRIIMIAESLSKVIPAIRSRCLLLRVPAPDIDTIITITRKMVVDNKGEVSKEFLRKNAIGSDRNLRRAIFMMEARFVELVGEKLVLTDKTPIFLPDWKTYLRDTADLISKETTTEEMLKIRTRLYELLAHCIPAALILREILKHLLSVMDSSTHLKLCELASRYEYNMMEGSKAIFHMEAFVANVMRVQEVYLKSLTFEDVDMDEFESD